MGADLTTVMNRALRIVSHFRQLPKGAPRQRWMTDPGNIASNNCQHFFRAVGEELTKQGGKSWTNELKRWDFEKQHLHNKSEGLNADEIVRQIDAEARRFLGSWRRVTPEDAQLLANGGAVVIGATPAKSRGDHGHLAFVSPLPAGATLEGISGSGPLVRDGNEHPSSIDGRIYPTTQGAARASKMWRSVTVVSWFVWAPSIPANYQLGTLLSRVHRVGGHR